MPAGRRGLKFTRHIKVESGLKKVRLDMNIRLERLS